MGLTTRAGRHASTGRPPAAKVAVAIGVSLSWVLAATGPAAAVNAPQSTVVSTNPADFTPQVMDGSVQSIVQIGNKIVAVGTFTTVRQTVASANVTRNRIFAFDATTGAIDLSFNPNLNGAANSVDSDGTYVYVGGSFSTVGGVSRSRVAKLTVAGALVPGFLSPSAAVNEVVVRGSRLFIGGAFKNVGGTANPRFALAAYDKNTMALLPQVAVPFTGLYNGGNTNIKRFDVSPDGSKLVAVGNFTSVGGQPRAQVAVVDLPATANATVATWSTDRFNAAHNASCASVFDTFMRDVDFSPDGSYFAVTATGAFGGGLDAGTLCDTTTRWESKSTGNDPTWADYTGGDTTYGVAVTGAAIYVGGHMRWENNPYQGDQAGAGAVPREGIAALDPVNGLPLTWNPGRARGVGAQALYATSTGLWVGSDTTRIGKETHYRLAFMPLAGGTSIPVVPASSLPNTLFLAQRSPTGSGGTYYRVNTGGPALQSGDNAADWSVDTAFRNDGSNSVDWGSAPPVDATVPTSTPAVAFQTERWDPDDATEMHFGFAVPVGRSIKVRLYFADRCDCTSTVGSRVFNVSVDGVAKLTNFDINASAGHNTGTMREFAITSDGTVDIDFGHVIENPLVDAIEIVDAAGGGTPPTPGALMRRSVDAAGSPTSAATKANSAIDWSLVRGAFLVNGTLYYGLADGRLYARTFIPATGVVGASRTVNLYDDPDTGERIPFAIANLTGMAYDTSTHRLYYTLFGDSQLYFRYFTPQSEVVGAQTFVGDSNGVDFSAVNGLTLAGGRLLYGSAADGALRAVLLSGGAVTGSPTVVSSDGSWKYRAIFVPSA